MHHRSFLIALFCGLGMLAAAAARAADLPSEYDYAGRDCGWNYSSSCAHLPAYRPWRGAYDGRRGSDCADGSCAREACGTWCWIRRIRQGYCGHGCEVYRARARYEAEREWREERKREWEAAPYRGAGCCRGGYTLPPPSPRYRERYYDYDRGYRDRRGERPRSAGPAPRQRFYGPAYP